MAASMAQASHLGTSAVVQPCSCRDVEGTSRRSTTSSVASFAGLKNAKSIPLASSLGDSAAQRDALRRSAFGSASVTTGGRKAVVCMAAEGKLVLHVVSFGNTWHCVEAVFRPFSHEV